MLVIVAIEVAVMWRTARFGVGEIEIDMSVPCSGTAQVYLDTGADFSEAESQSFFVSTGSNRITALLEARAFDRFRVDPPLCAERYSVRAVTARGPWRRVKLNGEQLRQRVVATNDTAIQGSKRLLQGAVTGPDPYLVLQAPGGITRNFARHFWLRVLGWAFLTILFVEGTYRVLRWRWLRERVHRTADALASWLSDPDFIVFTRATLLAFLLPFLLTVVLALLKVHSSSIEMWNFYAPQHGSSSIIFGSPLAIRSDEWKGIPSGLAPVTHINWALLTRPQGWGYLFNSEHGVAWYRNYSHLHLFTTCLALLLYLTRSALWLSILGAFWIFASSHLQWWGGMREIGNASLLILGTSYWLLGTQRRHIIGGGLVLAWALRENATTLYPPWQVPLAYWALFVAAASLLERGTQTRLKTLWKTKVALGVVGLVVGAAAGWMLWQQVGAQYALIADTVYPGERRSAAGGLQALWLFSGYYDAFLSATNFPVRLINACEASSFILVFPFSALILAIRALKGKQVPAAAIATLLHIGLLLWWMLGSVSPEIAKWTLFDRVPPQRVLGPLGCESIILAITMVAAGRRQPTFDGKTRSLHVVAAIVSAIAVLLLHAYGLHQQDPVYFTQRVTLVSIAMIAVIVAGLFAEKPSLLFLGIALAVAPNLLINPINQGFAPVTAKQVVREAIQLGATDPSAKWLVFGAPVPAKILAAAGVDVFNNRHYPDMKEMAVLDPTGADRRIWNRYSAFRHVWEVPQDANVTFVSPSPDTWGMGISPMSPLLDEIGVRFIVFDHEPSWQYLPGLRQASPGPVNGFWIFRKQPNYLPREELVQGKRNATQGCAELIQGESLMAGGVLTARVEAPSTHEVTDVVIEQGSRWERCLFGFPMADRVGSAKDKPDVVGVRCPVSQDEIEPTVHVLLDQASVLQVTRASKCGL